MTSDGRVSRVVARLLRPFQRDSPSPKHSATASSRPTSCSLSFSSRSSTSNSNSNSNSSSSSSTTSPPPRRRPTTAIRVVFPLKLSANGVPETVLMPPAFFRYLRTIVEQTVALSAGHSAATRASHRTSRDTCTRTRREWRWRREYRTKTLEKLLAVLTEDSRDGDGFASALGRRPAKPVPLASAVQALLQLWKCCLRILNVLAQDDSEGPFPAGSRHTIAHGIDATTAAAFAVRDKRRQLQQTVLTVLALVVRRQELDALFVAVGHGGCPSHKPIGDDVVGPQRRRRRSVSRAARRRSWSSSSSSNAATNKRTSLSSTLLRPCAARPSARTDLRLCDSVHRLLELHQLTLPYAFDAVQSALALPTPCGELQQDLLAALVATSYTRVPQLRSHMLDHLRTRVPLAAGCSARSLSGSFVDSRGRSACEAQRRYTPYDWHTRTYPQCLEVLQAVNRDDRWAPVADLLTRLMADADGCRWTLAQLLEQLTGPQVTGRTDWKGLPGAAVLHDASLELALRLYQRELQQCAPAEPDALAAAEDRAADESASTGKADQDAVAALKPAAYFMDQVTAMMHENVAFLHDYVTALFQATNYVVPHHVALCLQYVDQLMHAFPAFFANASTASSSSPSPSSLPLTDVATIHSATAHVLPRQQSCADGETLRYVFSCLLESEHFEILKATELFLLQRFTGLSRAVQRELIDVFAAHFPRLFLHWNHDVRYCYHHMLLYLTYPGNRLVLGAKSDEALMGAKAAWLFEIPGLVRHESSANWDAFDEPLYQLVTRYVHLSKRRAQPPGQTHAPSTWVDAVSDDILQRAMSEYKTHVGKYFGLAQQISMHRRVPTPVFSVSTGETATVDVDADRLCTSAILA
ncbi:unnamed protein product [Hyaloperonospora brassicae]|uniref:Uncharacterized protein n=1 Tax=Hyaloperonospora brassicae TaxID=162125 RepID=A0AAV0TSI9_HYABA|nr:unnamed protein product [Hyaloperonospora brassicae]